MKAYFALVLIIAVVVLSVVSIVRSGILLSQESPRLGRIGVLRMKNTDPSPANESMLKDFPARLNSALSATKSFDVPTQSALLEALENEGINPDDLIDLDDCYDAGSSLKADYIIIGSVSQKMMTLSTVSRVYSVAEKSLKAVISADLNMQRLSELIDVIAHRIGQAIDHPVAVDSLYASFQWSREFRFAFGPDRIDLQPPRVYFVNHNPPFEISLRAQMERVNIAFAVTNFEIYADNQLVAVVEPVIEPPRTLREKKISIGGHQFCFQTEVKELRGMVGRSISGALIAVTAWCCDNE